MTAYSSRSSVWKKTADVTLSKPMQIALFMGLTSVTIWTVFFSTYPPVHDSTHAVRHHTAFVACH